MFQAIKLYAKSLTGSVSPNPNKIIGPSVLSVSFCIILFVIFPMNIILLVIL